MAQELGFEDPAYFSRIFAKLAAWRLRPTGLRSRKSAVCSRTLRVCRSRTAKRRLRLIHEHEGALLDARATVSKILFIKWPCQILYC